MDKEHITLDEFLELGKDLTEGFFKTVDSMKEPMADQINATMSAIGQILACSYVKVVRDLGPEAGGNWLEQTFKLAQAITAIDGMEVMFAFMRNEEKSP